MKRVIKKRDKKESNKWQMRIYLGYDKAKKHSIRKTMTFYGTEKQAEEERMRLEYLYNFAEPEDSVVGNNSGTEITVSSYIVDWIDKQLINGTYKQTTYNRSEGIIRNYIVPELGDYKLTDLSAYTVDKFITGLLMSGKKCASKNNGKDGLSISSVRQTLFLLSKALNDAVKLNLVKDNVAAGVSAPVYAWQDIFALNQDDLIKVLERLEDSYVYYPALIASMTGMRLGEVLALTWDDIDFEEKEISVNRSLYWHENEWYRGSTKSKKSKRIITLNNMDVFSKIKLQQKKDKLKHGQNYENHGFVCARENGKPYYNNNLSKRFATILNKKYFRETLDLDKEFRISFHVLRHTHASILLNEGVSIKEISERLGHADPAFTLARYISLINNKQVKSANVVQNILSGTKDVV